ncbi:MAG: Lrp/AsnC family transcriptional regulator [Actinobacteria bacterium]|nr:Lrp/AsnC family transcriptional regulator [Actinomycetota bacterium]
MRSIELDSLDFEIVRVLSERPDLTNKAVAAALGIAESTCAYRVRKLRDSAVIRSRRLELDHTRLGYPLRAVIMVFLASHSREVVDRFMTSMVETPHVLQVMNLTGRYDFMITVAVADGEQLRGLVLDHITVQPAVRGTETHIVFDLRDGAWIPSEPE